MRAFYIVLIVLSGVYLLAHVMAKVFFGKTLFPDTSELFTDKKEKNLWQTVFPKNMLRLVILVFTGSLSGLFMDLAGMTGWVSLLFAPVAGIFFNFLISTVFSPIYLKFHKSAEPNDEELCELTGKVLEDIETDGFGVIEVRHGSRNYIFRAVSANGRFIPKGELVVVIYAQDACCFVESEEHLCDILFEDNGEEETEVDGETAGIDEQIPENTEKNELFSKKDKKF